MREPVRDELVMAAVSSNLRVYSIRKPVAAFLTGAAIALLAGLIGLGGAEFRLPLLIMVFALYPHRAVRINLLISFATLAAASVVRLQFVPQAQLVQFAPEIIAMSLGGVITAWIGAGALSRIPRNRMLPLLAALLAFIAMLLVAGAAVHEASGFSMAPGPARAAVALALGFVVGTISSLLGVAGGEFIIPGLVLIFGADIKTAGTASVLISLPIVITGVTRHFMAGKFRSRSMLAYLVLPMSLGSVVGAMLGGQALTWVSQETLRIVLAAILLASAWKLWRKAETEGQKSR
jgi:uncharacterized membrane protein YfcA